MKEKKRKKNWSNITLTVVNLIVLTLLLIHAAGLGFGDNFHPWNAIEIVTILLTVVTVILTSIAILIAIVAIWGYQRISDHAVDESKKAVDITVDKHLNSDEFTAVVAAMVVEKVDQINADTAREGLEITTSRPDHISREPDSVWDDDI